jgi:hypothetical protein
MRALPASATIACMPEAHIHVTCRDNGTWLVCAEDRVAPISEHNSETAAELAALAYASRCGDIHVVIHDRYHRVHPPALSDPTPRTRS